MKLLARQVDAFLRAPERRVLAVLVYGPDGGLVRERAQALVAAVVDDPGDPFRVVEFAAAALKQDPARLADEAAAISLTGGRRAVRVREAGDAQSALFQALLESSRGDALVIVEAGDLGPRSSLRRLFERLDNAAALPCYGDDARTLEDLIITTLGREGLRIDPAALAYLVEHLGGDRLISRGELTKLVIYMGPGGSSMSVVTLEDAMACTGDSAALGLEDVAFAAADGDQARLERVLARSFLAGNGAIAVLRATARHLTRLHLASGLRDGGASLETAMKSLRPPVFFKRAPAFQAQLRLWPTDRLGGALEILIEAEQDCKSTGIPQQAACGRALLRIAAAARAANEGSPRHD